MRNFEQQQHHQHMSSNGNSQGANRTPDDKEVIDIVNDKTRYGNDSQAGTGCDRMIKKKKKTTDVQNMGRLLEYDPDHSISSFKEKSSKKVIPDADSSDIVMLQKTKPSRKPRLTSVNPRVYNGFSFSIIHFLFAIANEEDSSAFGNHEFMICTNREKRTCLLSQYVKL
ncbi:hypothetical protein QYF36_024717 [Acer negundo]|nr:hypothetical protein QYF36_024717 [Acer negundo]